MKLSGGTHIGLVRENNQDALEYGILDERTQYAVLCDGMGGANGGNVASGIATQVITERIRVGHENGQIDRSPEYLFESAMAAANAEIYDRAKADPILEGMGTTVVAVILREEKAYISHVGDSRLYLFREKELVPITRDHSVVQDMIEKGQLTEEQARSHPRKHFITRALGVSEDECGEYDELPLKPGDRLLLCTDGLTNLVDAAWIRSILSDNTGQEAVDALIRAALDGGGTDNVTVILAEC